MSIAHNPFHLFIEVSVALLLISSPPFETKAPVMTGRWEEERGRGGGEKNERIQKGMTGTERESERENGD